MTTVGSGDVTLDLYALRKEPFKIEPSALSRDWMDATSRRFAYRCTPMNIANCSGWVASLPIGFTASWDGRIAKDAITINPETPSDKVSQIVTSHFGHGILTFQLGWLMRSSKGWAVWARGCPNYAIDGIFALEGIIETEWLDFPFTMNWRFTRPGSVTFRAHDPVCFFFLTPYPGHDHLIPTLRSISDDRMLEAGFKDWANSRMRFNQDLERPGTYAFDEKWQKKYLLGVGVGTAFHAIKRAMKSPKSLFNRT